MKDLTPTVFIIAGNSVLFIVVVVVGGCQYLCSGVVRCLLLLLMSVKV